MLKNQVTAKELISLLWHGSKAIDVLQASLEIGLLDLLNADFITLGELSQRLHCLPNRLYKLLDCLETLGFVQREQELEDINQTRYRSTEPLKDPVLEILGSNSIERSRDNKYQWQEIFGRLPDVVRGKHSVSSEAFDWPPRTDEQVTNFETSMAAGCEPIIDSFLAVGNQIWGSPTGNQKIHILDIGGGDGTLACGLVSKCPQICVDVYNLPTVAPLVAEKIHASSESERLGFIGGDFLREPLPSGYDILLFVRILHDWPAQTVHQLLIKTYDALPPGGKVVICEDFRSRERLALNFFWAYFLIGVDSCVYRLREAEFYNNVLSEVGFENIQFLSSSFDIIMAERPM